MTSKGIVITGAGGLLGKEFVRLFGNKRIPVFALIHRTNPFKNESVPANIKILRGDITKKDLGLKHGLPSETSEILHCASKTDFSMERAEAERVNVQGFKNLIAAARKLGGVQKIGVLSTTYVAGRRTGQILEDELQSKLGFVNEYEASKYRMEQYARQLTKILPISIYRLSTIIGSRDGRVEQFNAVHHALRLFYNGFIPMVPGVRNSPLNLIDSNFASLAIFYLFDKKYRAGKTYHIVSGVNSSYTVEEFLRFTKDLFEQFDPQWQRKKIELPPIVSLRTFDTLVKSVEKSHSVILAKIVHAIRYFAPQLAYPKVFDDRRARIDLRGTGISSRSLHTYYPKIIHYCLLRWNPTLSYGNRSK